jgi:hypothetical protein
MFANAVLWLLRNPERCAEMAQAARSLILEKYSWESRARAFEDIYRQIFAERDAKKAARFRQVPGRTPPDDATLYLPIESDAAQNQDFSALSTSSTEDSVSRSVVQ